jgi:uncharacterized membrane protein YccC
MTTQTSTGQQLVRGLLRIERARITPWTALRNALGVVLPLVVGVAVGQTLAGITIALGALQVTFMDQPGPYRLRAGRILLAGLGGALSVVVGSLLGANSGLAVGVAGVWGLGTGLLGIWGLNPLLIGQTGLILLLVYEARPMPPGLALAQGGLVLIGALLQTLLAVAPWPVSRLAPERTVLADLFRTLAAFVRNPPEHEGVLPATVEMTKARTTLTGIGSNHSAAGEALRSLLDETERIRLELVALDGLRRHLRAAPAGDSLGRELDTVWEATGDLLPALAAAVTQDSAPLDAVVPLALVESTIRAMRVDATAPGSQEPPGRRAEVLAHVDALAGQFRAVLELIAEESPAGAMAAAETAATRPLALRLRGVLAVLRANLTFQSAAFRHAVRLGLSVALAVAAARLLGLPHGYWLALTTAIVLRADFTATFTRGVWRVAGTLIGLVLATGLLLIITPVGGLPARIALLGLLVFLLRNLNPVNYGMFAIPLTAMAVVLTSFAGTNPEEAILERGLDTLLGGLLALGVYVAWPTWERTQAPTILAALLDAYRAYFDAAMAGYLQPDGLDHRRLHTTRLAARVARSNAEGSIERLRSEPGPSASDLDWASGLLANGRRFARSVMTLEARLYQPPPPTPPPVLRTFAADVDVTLDALAQALRDPTCSLHDLPDLRADQQALVAAPPSGVSTDGAAPTSGFRRAALTTETERITNSLNTLVYLLGEARGAKSPYR